MIGKRLSRPNINVKRPMIAIFSRNLRCTIQEILNELITMKVTDGMIVISSR